MRRGSVVFNSRVFIWIMALALLALGLASLAAPVFAQDSVVNQNADQVGLVNDSICSQVYNTAAQQYNAGDQTANAGAGVVADAVADQYGKANAAAIAGADATNIANATGIDLSTVNACLNGFAKAPGDGTPGGGTTNGEGTARSVAADVIIDTIPDQKVLADTGGPLLLLLALGLLFVTAGATMLRTLLRR